MFWTLIVLTAFLTFILWQLRIKLEVELEIGKKKLYLRVKMNVYILGISIKLFESKTNFFESVREVKANGIERSKNIFVDQMKVLKIILRNIEIRQAEIYSEVGTGDAAHTAIACGVVSNLIFPLLIKFSKRNTKRDIKVVPEYGEVRFVLRGTFLLKIYKIRLIYQIVKRRTSVWKIVTVLKSLSRR